MQGCVGGVQDQDKQGNAMRKHAWGALGEHGTGVAAKGAAGGATMSVGRRGEAKGRRVRRQHCGAVALDISKGGSYKHGSERRPHSGDGLVGRNERGNGEAPSGWTGRRSAREEKD
jgi:hypothetical protein